MQLNLCLFNASLSNTTSPVFYACLLLNILVSMTWRCCQSFLLSYYFSLPCSDLQVFLWMHSSQCLTPLKLKLDCELLTFLTGLMLLQPDIMIINRIWHMSQLQHSTAADCLDQPWHLTLNETFLSITSAHTHTCNYAHSSTRLTFYNTNVNTEWLKTISLNLTYVKWPNVSAFENQFAR